MQDIGYGEPGILDTLEALRSELEQATKELTQCSEERNKLCEAILWSGHPRERRQPVGVEMQSEQRRRWANAGESELVGRALDRLETKGLTLSKVIADRDRSRDALRVLVSCIDNCAKYGRQVQASLTKNVLERHKIDRDELKQAGNWEGPYRLEVKQGEFNQAHEIKLSELEPEE